MAKKAPIGAAWAPPEYEVADVAAVQALHRGDASPEQQKRALDWIIRKGAGTYDQSFRPGGADGARDTDFAEGRRSVGLGLIKFLHLNLSELRKRENG